LPTLHPRVEVQTGWQEGEEMKSYLRSLLAIALSLAMVLTILPGSTTVCVSADEEEVVSTETETEKLEVIDNYSVGTMIASEVSEISEETEKETDEESFGQITGITVTGLTAKVDFQVEKDSDLVVAVYTEDGLQMVASGTKAVTGSESSTSVTLEGDIPEYFLVTAFLLSTDGHEPMSEEYTSEMYTEGMQTLDSGVSGEVTWKLNGLGTLTISGSGAMDDYTSRNAPWYDYRESILQIVVESGVTSIGSYAFAECNYVEKIILSEGITSIGNWAFYNCASLAEITFPKTLEMIGKRAFQKCDNLKSVMFTYYDEIYYLSIQDYAFADCTSLTDISLSENVISIGNGAFSGCSALKQLILPESCGNLSLGYYIIKGTQITSIKIPKAVTNCSQNNTGPFAGAEKLTMVVFEDGMTTIPTCVCAGCLNLTCVVIPDTVTEIENYAFYGCSSLSCISLPASLVTVADYVFDECTCLTDIIIPEGVIRIGNYAFRNCDALTSVVFPSTLTFLGNFAFVNCDSLQNITFTDSYECSYLSIGRRAFANCISLTSVSLSENVTSIEYGAFSGCSSLQTLVLPDSVDDLSLGYCIIEGTQIASIEIPKTVASCGKFGSSVSGPFAGAECLTTVIFEGGMTTIPAYVCSGCQYLTSVTIPDTVSEIEEYAFYGCKGINEIYFEGSAPAFGSNVFTNVTATAYYDGSDSSWTSSVMADYGGAITWVNLTEEIEESTEEPCVLDAELGLMETESETEKKLETSNVETELENTSKADDSSLDTLITETEFVVESNASTEVSAQERDSESAELSSDTGEFESEEALTEAETIVLAETSAEMDDTDNPEEDESLESTETEYTVSEDEEEFLTACSSSWMQLASFNGSTTGADMEKISVFTGLLPGAEYVLLAVKDEEVDSLLDADNLLYIAQGTADGEGTLTFQYILREAAGTFSVSVYGEDTETVTDGNGSGTPAIVIQPEDYSGEAGDSVTFTIQAEGTNLSYKWQYSDDGETWKVGSSVAASYTTTLTLARSGRMVYCIVTDADGNSVTSEIATMTVAQGESGPVITKQPQDYRGASGDTITFTIQAEGSGLSYKWQYSNDGETWKIGSSVTASYTTTLTEARDGRMVRCIVTDVGGNSVTSEVATMTTATEESDLVIITQPLDYKGESGDTVTFTIQAEGSGLSYMWQYSSDGETWKTGSSVTTSYTTILTAARDGRQVRCIVSDSEGNSVTSTTVTMTIAAEENGLVITAQPQDYRGESGDTVTFTIQAEGSGMSYKWQYSSDGETWKTGASTTTSYTTTLTEARSGRQVRCIVTDANENSVTSAIATMTIVTEENSPVITVQPQDYSGAAGDVVTFTVQAVGNGLCYQWQYSDDGEKWKTGSSTIASYTTTLTVERSGRLIRCIVTDADGNSMMSDVAAMVVG